MSGNRSRNKGHAYERYLAQYLTKHTGFKWRRGLAQTRGGGKEEADVVCANPTVKRLVHIEAKRHKKTKPKQALRQAMEDVELGQIPIAITREDRGDSLVTIRLEDFIDMFSLWLEKKVKEDWEPPKVHEPHKKKSIKESSKREKE